ncbi:amino acid/amide ABC transporter membrane protein 2, HAAT family (TC 3.A.1.4.-) [Geosporobacter subterraneus DSM 17957]|uniref:Amino acid/amide ABC transporter membrane protein 2, HAAT family (TC 3.A.1.4.-) n=1 Tax=Geosporobacter subterraneus DSM 17957 TaxID=1121919 RepID=A0A1M6GKK3_9FIRM|nr:branched-chain amino acid ABC transporter permease [Geosporobacter subterraneus]SHJ10443.1 amino acid/amide ABC transporter membrane protein 2, HAAT family (TC 3.A.1.4.-) [Geosporobacter subterraneus DSM 17957]
MITILGLALLVLPLAGLSSFALRMFIMVGIYIILGLSLNLITGFTGQLSLGHAAFYAIGAYTSAILSTRYGLGFGITAPLSGLAAAFFGLLLGIPTLKLQGAYLAIVTLGFGEIVRITALNWMNLTRGPMGIPGIPSVSLFGYELQSNIGYYYVIYGLAAVTLLVVFRIVNSRIGRALMAIREDELAAQYMGVYTTNYKVLAFTIGAFFAGIAGSFYAHYVSYIDPQSFTFDESIQILSIVILGGMGSIPGTILGASILVTAPEMLRSLQDYRMVIYGLILILMMLIRPQGLLGGVRFGKGGKAKNDASGSKEYNQAIWRAKSS